jgi:hypothetical protein
MQNDEVMDTHNYSNEPKVPPPAFGHGQKATDNGSHARPDCCYESLAHVLHHIAWVSNESVPARTRAHHPYRHCSPSLMPRYQVGDSATSDAYNKSVPSLSVGALQYIHPMRKRNTINVLILGATAAAMVKMMNNRLQL